MLKLLIKKQLYEQFRSMFVNQKTLKKRSKKSTIGIIALYAGILILLAFSFFGISYSMSPLLEGEYAWLYYAFLGSIAITLGIVVSAINSHTSLFKPKDNDLLLSMPIETKDILMSRLFVLYFLGFMYSACAWLPTIIVPMVIGHTSITSIMFSFLVLFINPLLISAISSIFGYIIALISNIFKNRNSIVSIISLLFLGAYLYASTKIDSGLNAIVDNSAKVGSFYQAWLYPIYAMGKGCTGDVLKFVIYAFISFGLFALVTYLLSINYVKLIIKGNETNSIQKKAVFSKQSSVKTTLLKREFKHFISSSTYTVNCGLGVLMMIGLAIFAIIKGSDVSVVVDALSKEGITIVLDILPIAVICVVSALATTCFVSTPSISLEGKNLWILKSLPISFRDISEAKELLHVLIVGVPALIVTIVISISLKVDFSLYVEGAVLTFLIVYLEAVLGLIIGILNPNLNWTSEVLVIKQGINVLISMLIGIIIPVIIAVSFYLTMNITSVSNFLYSVNIVLIILIVIAKRWLDKKGTVLFNKLN